MQLRQLELWIGHPSVEEIQHGDCVGGDFEAHKLALKHGKRVVIRPPVNPSLRAFADASSQLVTVLPPKPYIPRNHDIVDDTDHLLALPITAAETLASGTWATVRYARRLQRPHTIITP